MSADHPYSVFEALPSSCAQWAFLRAFSVLMLAPINPAMLLSLLAGAKEDAAAAAGFCKGC